ncbi:helix-turn-helix domain-containing protein [Maritalea porphyrae]|uniref:HTH cro/C1-type domain-containing protein n=1 Tax=Maritalea porphyrae TaxID=880732 RepID=A0ABQ5ULF4_9HYPH|nr:helix-turn-helix domain-containing protein [Maritalea porphyrae]GLQ15871.1 hypothetical protein GCM10007879_01200 [Maritalea porphyrae]
MNKQQFYHNGTGKSAETYHYKECGLENIYLSNGFIFDEFEGEQVVAVKDIDALHEAIGLHIVLERKVPSGKELRFLRAELDMTQAELATMLNVSSQSVARWEKEECEVNGGAVLALKLLFALKALPEDVKDKLVAGLVDRLDALSKADESDQEAFVLTYSNDNWFDQLIAA